ncbi:hypothetical protein PUN28_011632 [Cardiocondyla obscurior]|uniref:Uncharacterized protein n=1 Tax=Cardiocondyla obscurior TaxID=286306 RepID=A0AAW2FKF0_9HYME
MCDAAESRDLLASSLRKRRRRRKRAQRRYWRTIREGLHDFDESTDGPCQKFYDPIIANDTWTRDTVRATSWTAGERRYRRNRRLKRVPRVRPATEAEEAAAEAANEEEQFCARRRSSKPSKWLRHWGSRGRQRRSGPNYWLRVVRRMRRPRLCTTPIW